jgi:hypothetical protein
VAQLQPVTVVEWPAARSDCHGGLSEGDAVIVDATGISTVNRSSWSSPDALRAQDRDPLPDGQQGADRPSGVTGVAVGVFIFIFMSALIGGLAEFILSRTVGDISHITIEAETPTRPC